jgi:hypothetical protein
MVSERGFHKIVKVAPEPVPPVTDAGFAGIEASGTGKKLPDATEVMTPPETPVTVSVAPVPAIVSVSPFVYPVPPDITVGVPLVFMFVTVATA